MSWDKVGNLKMPETASTPDDWQHQWYRIGSANADAQTLVRIAGADLSGHRVVYPTSGGRVLYASQSETSWPIRPLWLTTGAAMEGQNVTVVQEGFVEESSWHWSIGPVFLGNDGQMTQVMPTTGLLVVLGWATTGSRLVYDPELPIVLAG